MNRVERNEVVFAGGVDNDRGTTGKMLRSSIKELACLRREGQILIVRMGVYVG